MLDKAGYVVLADQTFDPRADTGNPPLYPGSDIFASRRTTALSPSGLYAVQGSGFDVASTMVWFVGEAVTPFPSATGEIAVKVHGSIAGRSTVAVRVEAAGTMSNSIVMPPRRLG